ncbi:MAG: PAS domain S-box protein [Gammaproteobacteria bacterium]|nr:PAS domain S-box protein [Gammaproteobacteria bacterium]
MNAHAQIGSGNGTAAAPAGLNRPPERRTLDSRFEGLLNAAPDAMLVADLDGCILSLNHQVEQLFGYTQDELRGQPVEILLPERLRNLHGQHREGFSQAPATRQMGLGRALSGRRRDGTEFPVEVSLSTLPSAAGSLIVAAIRDITDRKALEAQLTTRNRELTEATAFLNSVLESATEYSIVALDPDGRILSWNEGARRLYGYAADEMVGKATLEVLHTPEDRAGGRAALLLAIARGAGQAKGVFERLRKDGGRFHASVGLALRRDAEGRPIGFLLVSRDVTEEKALADRLERKTREAEEQSHRAQMASRLKSEFLANMSHELRTPLNAIIGFTKMLHNGSTGPLSPEQHDFIGDVLTSAQHLLKLIDDVLDLSKIEAGKMTFSPEPVNLQNTVDEVLNVLHSLIVRKQIKVSAVVDPSLNDTVLDPAKLKQVLYNYLSNAIKFAYDRGQVCVRAVPEGPDRFRIEVEDDGIGIETEDIPRLFVEFQQLDASTGKKFQGTGLGLALTRRIVEAQGGRVGVSSVPGSGSTFYAVLPRRPNVAEEGST